MTTFKALATVIVISAALTVIGYGIKASDGYHATQCEICAWKRDLNNGISQLK